MYVRATFPHPGQQYLFRGADGRICGQHEDRDIHSFHRTFGGVGVVLVNRADPRCVDQFGGGVRQAAGQMNDHFGDTALVAGIAAFGDVSLQLCQRRVRHGTVHLMNIDSFGIAQPHRGGHRGEGNDASR